jgi:hypothetical protein
MTEDVTEIFAVVVEGQKEGPILMETEGHHTCLKQARDRLDMLLASHAWFRGCVVRLEYADGNRAVLHAMKGMQQ